MLCSVYTTIAGEYCDPPCCTPIGKKKRKRTKTEKRYFFNNTLTYYEMKLAAIYPCK